MDIVDELIEKKTRDNTLLINKAIIGINTVRLENERLKRQNIMLRKENVMFEGDIKDLLEENKKLKQKTCENLVDIIDEFKCSKCGYWCDDVCSLKKDDDGEVFHYDFRFKFCPNCGAKVKE